MHFKVITKTIPDFDEWTARASENRDQLDLETYAKLSRPSTNYPVTVFSPVVPGLFNHVMQSFMGWTGEHQNTKQMDMDTMKKGN
jgi:cytochrome o ubiquinol oxidase subunit 2